MRRRSPAAVPDPASPGAGRAPAPLRTSASSIARGAARPAQAEPARPPPARARPRPSLFSSRKRLCARRTCYGGGGRAGTLYLSTGPTACAGTAASSSSSAARESQARAGARRAGGAGRRAAPPERRRRQQVHLSSPAVISLATTWLHPRTGEPVNSGYEDPLRWARAGGVGHLEGGRALGWPKFLDRTFLAFPQTCPVVE